jgi:hypothetical protein
VNLDTMAGIRVRTHSGYKTWEFNPHSIHAVDGLPWMRPEDWLDLYDMFDRPERVELLRHYFDRR